jgi:asparagine synthase (glutamine-hydrolysing)
MPAPFTVAASVYQLLPGSWLRYSRETNSIKTGSYQQFFGSDRAVNPETSPEQLESGAMVLKSAVERQLVSDVPLGIFLSGGIDSALMVAMASRVRPDVETLTIGFDQPGFDESTKAAEYARILGVKNQCIVLSDNELLNLFDEHNKALTEPFADYSSLPTYLISKVASSRFKVMLSGDGGDELFWGYPRFRTFARSAGYFRIPTSFARRATRRLLKSVNRDITGYLYTSSVGEANLNFHSYLNPSLLDSIWPESDISDTTKVDYLFTGTEPKDTLLHLRQNEFYQHLQKILVKVDRASMSNGLEVRVPILDKQVIQFAENIGSEMLTGHHVLKYLLKNVLYQYIPFSIVENQKRGFTPPLKVWARGVLRDEISEILNQIDCLSLPFRESDALMKYAHDYLSGKHNNLEGAWTIYTLTQWYLQLRKVAVNLPKAN